MPVCVSHRKTAKRLMQHIKPRGIRCRAIVPNGSTRRAAEASYGCSAVCLTNCGDFTFRSIGDNRSTNSVEPLSPMALHDAQRRRLTAVRF